GRTRAARRAFLVDRDRGTEAVETIDGCSVHAAQEAARVGRHALEEAALAFLEDRVEREARLARTRRARDDRELAERHVAVDALQVVRARAAYLDVDGPRHALALGHARLA